MRGVPLSKAERRIGVVGVVFAGIGYGALAVVFGTLAVGFLLVVLGVLP